MSRGPARKSFTSCCREKELDCVLNHLVFMPEGLSESITVNLPTKVRLRDSPRGELNALHNHMQDEMREWLLISFSRYKLCSWRREKV